MMESKKWVGMFPDKKPGPDLPMVNPAERAAAQPGVPEGWPWKGA